MTLTSNVIAVRGAGYPARTSTATVARLRHFATLVLYLHPEAELRPAEIPCFLSNYAESLALLIQALALLIWLLIAFVHRCFTSSMPAPAGI